MLRFLGLVHEPKRMLKYIVAAAGIICATVLLEELLRLFGVENVELALLFMLSTFLIACYTASYAINITSATVNAFLYDYFVTAPRLGFSFTLGLPITLLIMLTVSVITSATTTKIKEQMALARQQEHRTELMLEINKGMSLAGSVDDIVRVAADYMSLYALSGIFYVGEPAKHVYVVFSGDDSRPAPALTEAGVQAAQSHFSRPGESQRQQTAPSGVCYIPVTAGNATLGIIELWSEPAPPSKDQVAFAHILAGQTALAMELRQVTQERTRTMMMAEKEKTLSNLLRAISHDLRTPLTGILSAGFILEERTGDPLATDICRDLEWLIHMVENLLMVTRISDDSHCIAKKAEIAEEVMARATTIVRKRFPGCNILVNAPDDLAIVPMDAMLMSQVFINLLENAAKYSPAESAITFDLRVKDQTACFTIGDSGEGIPADLLDDLFGQHSVKNKRAVDSASGMGLGLSICKTIVEAHGGTIGGENKDGGGALFTVCLPLDA